MIHRVYSRNRTRSCICCITYVPAAGGLSRWQPLLSQTPGGPISPGWPTAPGMPGIPDFPSSPRGPGVPVLLSPGGPGETKSRSTLKNLGLCQITHLVFRYVRVCGDQIKDKCKNFRMLC